MKELLLQYQCCSSCGYIGLSHSLTDQEYTSYYEKSPGVDISILKEHRDLLFSERNDFINRNFTSIASKAVKRVIEVGPSYGDFLLGLNFDEKIGIEPSQTHFDFVMRERPELAYRQLKLEDVPHKAQDLIGSSDLVIACHVLEHAKSPTKFMEILTSLTSRGGYLFIEVPSLEGMAKVTNLSFQNLHFGHVSQFGLQILLRLGSKVGLQPVTIEESIGYDYPALRVLFRKSSASEHSSEVFLRHCDLMRECELIAEKNLLKGLQDSSPDRPLVLWGCGQDLFDILNQVWESHGEIIKQRAIFVDSNPAKQKKQILGIKIQPPNAIQHRNVERVFIASRSLLISEDIAKSAKSANAKIQVERLYP